ncbi:putative nuclease HARBI1 [Chenopodium quinoa]|uniref:putative nuclease HARBI1 n=1 Tax=Chenopodium quinoa TaxID=63459 RepID=UPI000B78F2EF|nr:putative nuclease HARBI1 [Chenopodium quinoa]
MNSDSNSSSSSSSGLFDYMVNDYVEWHESITQRRKEDDLIEEAINIAVVPFVTSPYQVPFTLEPTYQRWYVPRDREYADIQLYNDYFSPQPLYPDNMFRRRFRMRKNVFTRIVNKLSESDVYFQQRPDATGRLGASPLQKCTAAIRMLAYGTSADAVDGYLKIASSTAREGLAHFVEGVVAQFGPKYLRRASTMDAEQLLRESYVRGFPGMMGSIDCMHWEWKNCPRAWKGMYQGRSKTATVILEAVASQDLWIWHAFFGTPGSCNDINVLQRSPVFSDICEGKAPEVTFNVNGNTYNMGYYLTDGIYPKWATFIPAIKHPQTGKHKLFTKKQESYRKDVERAFGVLQARFAIIRQPSLAWSTEILLKIVMACIIMHNMIVEDERDGYLHYDATEFINDQPQNLAGSPTGNNNQPFTVRSGRLDRLNLNGYMENRNNVRDRETHIALKNDLVEHIWGRFGNE